MGPKKVVNSPTKRKNCSSTKISEFNFSHSDSSSKKLRTSDPEELSQNISQQISGGDQIMAFLGSKIDKLSEDVNKSIAKLSESLTVQQKDIFQLKSYVDSIKKFNIGLSTRVENSAAQCEIIERELKRINLVITGLSDPDNESVEILRQKVAELCSNVSNCQIKVDSVCRIGKLNLPKPRQVLVRVFSMSDRDLVWANRKNTVPPVFINEDLPFTLRRDYGILRQRARDLRNDKVNAEINWKNKSITTGTEVLEVINGKLTSNVRDEAHSSQKGMYQKRTPTRNYCHSMTNNVNLLNNRSRDAGNDGVANKNNPILVQ